MGSDSLNRFFSILFMTTTFILSYYSLKIHYGCSTWSKTRPKSRVAFEWFISARLFSSFKRLIWLNLDNNYIRQGSFRTPELGHSVHQTGSQRTQDRGHPVHNTGASKYMLTLEYIPKMVVLWRAGYTPADRQTSWGVLHHTAQYLYSACI